VKELLLIALVLGSMSCTRSGSSGQPATRPDRSNYTAKAADCLFTMPDSSPVLGESEVDDPPRMIAPGPQRFPPEQRRIGQGGSVTVTYVIDTQGRAIVASIRSVHASDRAFIPPTVQMLEESRFSPAVHGGRVIAVCVRQTVNFTLQ
jgi:TonB family protein